MKSVCIFALFAMALLTSCTAPQVGSFNGLGLNLGNLSRLSDAQTRSISPENFTGEKGMAGMSTNGPAWSAARDLGQGWKVSPFINVPAKGTVTLGEISGAGAIQQIWMTPAPIDKTRFNILRFYWDGETTPSVEVPLGDFFACGWGKYCQINSMPVCVNPGSAFNCYWIMPFHKGAKVTLENLDEKPMRLYYQINYTLTDVPVDAATFHADRSGALHAGPEGDDPSAGMDDRQVGTLSAAERRHRFGGVLVSVRTACLVSGFAASRGAQGWTASGGRPAKIGRVRL